MENPFSEIAVPAKHIGGETASLVLNNLPDSVVLTDKALNVVYFNSAARKKIAQFLKINVRMGMLLTELVATARRPALLAIARNVLNGKIYSTENHPGLQQAGEDIYKNIFSPARNEAGEIIGILIQSVNITGRKKAERAVQDAEERWQFAFEASNQAAWDWNMQTNEVIYSSSYKKMYGFLGDDLKNDLSEWQDRIHPEDKGRIEQAVQEHSQSDNPYHETTYRIQLKNGDYKWIMARGKLLSKDKEGRPLRMIGTHTDLTETLQAKAEIKKMNERFEFAAKASSQALWEWNALTGEAYVSPSFTEMFGWGVDENHRFDQWHDYVHPDDRKNTVDHYYHTLQNTAENIWQSGYRFLKADGSYAYVNDKAYIFRNEQNEVQKVIGATQDVTALKRTEEELLKSNERYNIVLKAMNELIWEWDIDTGNIARPSEGIKKIYGLENDSLIKNIDRWLNRIHPEEQEEIKQKLALTLEGEHMQAFEMEYRLQREDGFYNDIFCRGILLRNDSGKAVRMIGSAQNISERKRLERELLQNELEMKKRINQATVDSQEKERGEIGRELHDNISQVLTTTKLYLELATTNTEIAKELLLKSCENIGDIIGEIRQLSRSLMDPTIGDLGIVKSIAGLAENLNLTQRVCVTLNIDEAIETALDKAQKLALFRIIQESLNNVVKHAKAALVAIDISLKNNCLCLVIKDDGQGFLPGSVKKGAGLNNITNRVYLINGTFTLDSLPGNGCKIKINFPLKNHP